MVVIYSGENYQCMLHLTGCKWVGEQDIYILKVSPKEYTPIIKEVKIASQRENRHDLNLIIMLTSSIMGKPVPTDLMCRGGHNIMWYSLVKTV